MILQDILSFKSNFFDNFSTVRVERSFLIYKRLLADKQRSFLIENIKQQIIIKQRNNNLVLIITCEQEKSVEY